ncbi:hypothetical protein IOD16_21295 [Saccharothrix sp. 6-C]|uniref:hypothetical protein n=1 Tax=Saccharothrix sp. 6-C TaxID=2781735 RepID=UPI001917710F|nr:hypothetical protein [Saccharothrix sp. 6-C]QQQ73789.1 hypothetical protein IOD16_21295 [Saccharothrix sp. 6-C]
MGAVVWALPVVVGLVLPLWEDGPPPGASSTLVIAGLLLRARQAHAERPGAWFPLLVAGSTMFAPATAGESAGGWSLPAWSVHFDLWRFLLGLVVAVGLGAWAWRARSRTVALTAAGYLAAVWCFEPSSAPVAEFGWMSYGPVGAPTPSPDALVTVDPSATGPYPELVVVAGAVLAHARLGRVRPWHVTAIAGLLGSLWHWGAFALLVVAAVAAAHDLHARRPGAWYPLLLVGVGLVVWPVLLALTAPAWPGPTVEDLGATAEVTALVAVDRGSSAVAVSFVDHDDLFMAFVVAAGLAVWSWRRKSPVVALTAVVYLGLTWLRTAPVRTELVVLAGAAVALATTAAPGAARTAGRSAGTPDLPPGP